VITLDPLNRALAAALTAAYSIYPSYGFAIVALTLVVSIVLAPLTWVGLRSQTAMARMQPELARIRRMYRGDSARLQAETAALFKANHVNPLGGCLPLLLQAPVFLGMYQVIRA
jgi:YidC/Oxa1 family membrane protein insertase